jgi:hypothetical protein
MAIYYVSPTGNNSNDGLGAGNDHAWLTVAKAETVAVAGDTVKILPGTYNETVLFDANGTAENPITFEAYDPRNKPVISGVGKSAHTVEVWGDYLIFNNLAIQDSPMGSHNLQIRGEASHVVFNDIELRGHPTAGNGSNLILIQTWNDITFNRLRAENAGGSDVYMSGNASDSQSVTFNYSIIGGHRTGYAKSAIGAIQRIGNDGVITVNINNSLVYGGNQAAIHAQYEKTTVNIKNSIIMSSPMGVFQSYSVIYTGTTSAFVIDHSLILGPPGGTYTSYYSTPANVTEGVGVVKNTLPLFIRPRSPLQWFNLRNDDYDLDYWEAAAAVYEAHGVRGTFYGVPKGLITKPNYAERLAALVNAGHDVGAHGYSHVHVTSATWGLAVQYTGGGASCTLTNDGATFATNCSVAEHSVSYDLASAAYDSLDEVKNALNATGNYNASVSAVDNYGWSLMTSLADVAAQDIKTASYQCLFDAARFRSDETVKAKTWFDATIQGAGAPTYSCQIFCYPYNETDDSYAAAVQAAEYIGTPNAAAWNHSGTLEEVYPYRMHCATPSMAWDATEADFRAATRAAIAGIQQSAMLGQINSHMTTEASATELGWIIDELQTHGIQIRLLKDILADVTTSGLWADADGNGTRWTRTLTDVSDYRPRPGSPLINAGVAIAGLTTDFAGRSVPYSTAPTIGPYEYRPTAAVRR